MTGADRTALIGVLAVDDEGCRAAAAVLAAAVAGQSGDRATAPACGGAVALPRGVSVLPREAFRPRRPFSGPLFAALESMALAGLCGAAAGTRDAAAVGPCLGLVVPLARLQDVGADDDGRREVVVDRTTTGAAVGSATPPSGARVAITDHVDLAGPGPLTGSWPAGRARTFPAMRGVYAADVAAGLLDRAADRKPADGRSAAGPAIYSRLAVAGVADTGRPTVFEVEQARAAGLLLVSSCLVAPVVIAAYYGLVVAAVGVLGDL